MTLYFCFFLKTLDIVNIHRSIEFIAIIDSSNFKPSNHHRSQIDKFATFSETLKSDILECHVLGCSLLKIGYLFGYIPKSPDEVSQILSFMDTFKDALDRFFRFFKSSFNTPVINPNFCSKI